jgi:hypothetical protein
VISIFHIVNGAFSVYYVRLSLRTEYTFIDFTVAAKMGGCGGGMVQPIVKSWIACPFCISVTPYLRYMDRRAGDRMPLDLL